MKWRHAENPSAPPKRLKNEGDKKVVLNRVKLEPNEQKVTKRMEKNSIARGFLRLLSGLIFWRDRGEVKFKRGERVRISSYEKIRKTLDTRNCYEGLFFMESMAKFCGGDYEVLREVKWVYDESSKKMLNCKDIVVLKDLVCDGKGILGENDCDRSCLYFWKTVWLEKQ